MQVLSGSCTFQKNQYSKWIYILEDINLGHVVHLNYCPHSLYCIYFSLRVLSLPHTHAHTHMHTHTHTHTHSHLYEMFFFLSSIRAVFLLYFSIIYILSISLLLQYLSSRWFRWWFRWRSSPCSHVFACCLDLLYCCFVCLLFVARCFETSFGFSVPHPLIIDNISSVVISHCFYAPAIPHCANTPSCIILEDVFH